MRNRWTVLLAFTGLAGMSQMLWLNFAPLVSFLKATYHVSEGDINILLTAFPLIYVLLSMHAGMVIDRRGYRFSILAGGLLMAVFACVRSLDQYFFMLQIGQIGIALGQPYVMNAISKLVADWFEPEQQATATGIGTIGMFGGMALALAGTPALNDTIGFQPTMAFFAGLTILSTLFFWWVGHPNPHRTHAAAGQEMGWRDVLPLLKNRQLVLLSIISLLGLGFFNGLTSWLEQILKPYGVNSEQAGLIGGVLIIGGIFGAIVIPMISDKLRKRKPFLLLGMLAGCLLTYPLCTMGNVPLLLLIGGVMGFSFLPAYALLLSVTEESVEKKDSGKAASLILMTGNIGAVVVILGMQMVTGNSVSWINAVYLMLVIGIVCTLFTLGIREKWKTE